MTTLILRPTSGTGTSWTNISNVYDNSTSTSATVSVTSSNYSSNALTLNFDTSLIPSGVNIDNATLTIVCKQSSSNSSRRLTPYVDINGDSSKRVLSTQLTTTQSTTQTSGDISSYISELSTVKITPYSSTTKTGTFTLYEVYITVEYTELVNSFTVTFKDWDGTILKTETVQSGASAIAPSNLIRDGYTFTGWDKSFTNITSDLEVTAQYVINEDSNSNIKRYTFICTGYDDIVETGNESIYISTNVTVTEDEITNTLSQDDEITVDIINFGTAIDDTIYLKLDNIENIENIKSAKIGIKYKYGYLVGTIMISSTNKLLSLSNNNLNTATETFDITECITSNTLNIELYISTDENSSTGSTFNIDYVYLDIEYQEQQNTETVSNLILSDKIINKIFVGDKSISKIFLGEIKLFDTSNSNREDSGGSSNTPSINYDNYTDGITMCLDALSFNDGDTVWTPTIGDSMEQVDLSSSSVTKNRNGNLLHLLSTESIQSNIQLLSNCSYYYTLEFVFIPRTDNTYFFKILSTDGYSETCIRSDLDLDNFTIMNYESQADAEVGTEYTLAFSDLQNKLTSICIIFDGVYDGGSSTIYINNELVINEPFYQRNLTISNDGYLVINTLYDNSYVVSMELDIACIRLYKDKVLTAEEISNNYNLDIQKYS